LLCSFYHVTATGLSHLLDGAISHDKITRLLSGNEVNSKSLWNEVKPLVREYESEDACLIFDDTIISKPYMDENALVSWRWYHSKGGNEKGINLLTAFYHTHRIFLAKGLCRLGQKVFVASDKWSLSPRTNGLCHLGQMVFVTSEKIFGI
jgi:hypothetical protein